MSIELRRRDLSRDVHVLLDRERALLEWARLFDLLQGVAETLIPLDKRYVSSLDSEKYV